MIVVSDAINMDKSGISNSQQYKWKSMMNHTTSRTEISTQRISYGVGCAMMRRRWRRWRWRYVGCDNGDSRHNGRPVIAKYTAGL